MTVITVTGPPGSGTTTVSKLVAQEMGIRFVYAGAVFREMAKKHNMDLPAFIAYADRNPEFDHELDREQVRAASQGNVLLEGRVSAHLLKKEGISSFNVWMDADPRVRASRVAQRDGTTLDEALRANTARERKEILRFMRLYDFDLKSREIYNLILDTSRRPPEELARIIIREANANV